MTAQKSTLQRMWTSQMVVVGLGLAALYWILETFLYIVTSTQITFIQWLVGNDFGGIWTRLIALCLFAIFGSHAQFTINKRREAEEALRQSEARYRMIIENIEDGYYEVDLTGGMTFSNPAMCRILGYTEEKCTGTNLLDSMDAENAGKVVKTFHHVKRTGSPVRSLDCILRDPKGNRRFAEASVSLIQSHINDPMGFRGILRDVTERKKADLLEHAKLAAEAASHSKSVFLANMSHEIRTPLNAIIGLVKLVLETPLNAEQREDLNVVMSSSYGLLSVINDILDFSKIEAGKLELEEVNFNLREFLADSLKIMTGRAHEKNLGLTLHISSDTPDHLIGDPARLRQILLNLIGNAIKFTHHGDIVTSVAMEQAGDKTARLRFSVKDTGIGIPIEKQERIFSPFQQGDESIARRFGGTGLGLAVSRQLVALMGGEIWVDSEEEKGSTFHFTARFGLSIETDRRPSADAQERVPQVPSEPLRILVAEDTVFNQKFITRLLDRWHYTSVVVDNGRQALDALKQQTFDLVLMDVQMPDMDGFEATRAIRDHEKETGRHIPIIAMTAHAMKGDRERCMEAGMDAYVPKPISSETLMEAIRHTFESRPPSPNAVTAHGPGASEIDNTALLNAFDNDLDLFRESVNLLVEAYPPMLDALQQAIQNQDALTLERTAHAVKGMVGNFQADDAAGTARMLEKKGREKDFDGVRDICHTLAGQLENLKNRLHDCVKETIH